MQDALFILASMVVWIYTGIVSLVIAISYAITPKYLVNRELQNDGDIVAS
jgi:hypothetical protein